MTCSNVSGSLLQTTGPLGYARLSRQDVSQRLPRWFPFGHSFFKPSGYLKRTFEMFSDVLRFLFFKSLGWWYSYGHLSQIVEYNPFPQPAPISPQC